MSDVLVVGAGPAGWAVAGALIERGAKVRIVAPEPTLPFRPKYGAWVDEIGDWVPPDVWAQSWPSVDVYVSESDVRRLHRRYARINNKMLRRWLVARAAGCELSCGRIRTVREADSQFEVVSEDGTVFHAQMVVDASGHQSPLIAQASGPESGWQAALGWTLEVESGHPWGTESAVLMDFRSPDTSVSAANWPSFLYALPESPTRVFVEETSLIRRPAVSFEALKQRLENRLKRLGVRPRRVLHEERCLIPMGGPPAPPTQPVVAFGGAARMVHPGTGYMLSRVLRTAPRLADAIVLSLHVKEGPVERACRAWEAVWTPAERRTHDLLRFGSEVLMNMDTSATCAFFGAFFSLPEAQWATYLSGCASPRDTRAVMLRVFANINWSLRWHLLRSGLGSGGQALRQGLL